MTASAPRPARPEDAAALAALLARVASPPTETPAEVGRELIDHATTWVVERDGEISGFATVRARGALIADGELVALAEAEEPLLDALESQARTLGTPILRLNVR